jgi:hypothetical protein
MLHRRDAMIRLGRIGLGAVTLPQLLHAEAAQAGSTSRSIGTAKSCILIYLWGGPPQQDLWDMKPESADGIRSQFRPISTVIPGIDVCEHLPLFARHTDKTALVRSVTHDSNNHEPSVYRTLTGRINNTLAMPRNKRNRSPADRSRRRHVFGDERRLSRRPARPDGVRSREGDRREADALDRAPHRSADGAAAGPPRAA